MDRAGVAAWLQRYVDAWKSYDREAITGLFGEEAEYRYHPYDEPVVGRSAIVDSWLDDLDEPGTYDAHYEPVAIEGDVAVARGTSTYFDDSGKVEKIYDNLYLMAFDEDGRCIDFTEWFMKRPDQP